mmetsp:Transcript_8555/g.15632  ORF Transcript_8555/g.15632 Transcript_8555/m.15632 type:complete len:89 (-) Transcript_8555:98-364(-)
MFLQAFGRTAALCEAVDGAATRLCNHDAKKGGVGKKSFVTSFIVFLDPPASNWSGRIAISTSGTKLGNVAMFEMQVKRSHGASQRKWL